MPDFVTYCLQNAQTAVLDSLIFHNFPGKDAPGPPTKSRLRRSWGPLTTIQRYLLLKIMPAKTF